MQAVFGSSSLEKIIRARQVRSTKQIPAGPLQKCVRTLVVAAGMQNPE